MQTPSVQYLSATEPATSPMTTEATQFANASLYYRSISVVTPQVTL
ncbi:hypothetical protein OESDEN_14978 [Oesophagostomum dentatum]|uniref:Uncharacterized protein n=1 Tax=Oesophagostomum dentatum TaxID=61180 RepID=A0A0B1SK39_OESDE|nr:hypothetical protein OESDEN_14978 [Oesophagostomum dentatum]